MVGPLSTELVLAALATCRHYLAELRLRLQNGHQLELCQTVYFAPARSVELPLEPLAASTREEEPPKRSSARLLRLLHRDCHLCPRFRRARLLPRYPGHFARSASSRHCGCGKPGGGWRGRLPEAAWRRAGRAAGGVRGGRGQLRAADGAAGCRGRAADGEASCGLCGRRAGQLLWRRLAGSVEAGDEHGGRRRAWRLVRRVREAGVAGNQEVTVSL